MKKRVLTLSASTLLLFSLCSCGNKMTGKITFALNGGSFPADFGTQFLEGESGTPVYTEIPTPVKSGYYFVGWREKTKNGAYQVINKRTYKDGKSYYFYPYVNDVFYAYFEPLSTISFDLTEGTGLTSLVAPKVDPSSFQNGKLNGYASKKIVSMDYLPTVDSGSSHLTFDYWYTKYPLKGIADENGQKHYSLDTEGEIGEYVFERSFGTDNMSFPISEENDFVLYAKWSKDPTITIHYNLDGVSDSVFQAKDNISSELISEMREKTSIDLSATDCDYFYTSDKKKRFNGFYLDQDLKSRFNLDSTISDLDVDLYLGWDDLITVTLEYGDGNVDGKQSDVFSDQYYSGDILGLDFFREHVPTCENKTFVSFQWEGKEFDFSNDALPKRDVVLTAVYQEDPVLKITADYPTGYSGEKISDKSYSLKEGTDISDTLNEFKNQIQDENLVAIDFYQKSGEKKTEFTMTKMPSHDQEIFLEIKYLPKIEYSFLFGTGNTYQSVTEYGSLTKILPLGVSLTEDFFQEAKASRDYQNQKYLFDGFYLDNALSEEAIFPLYLFTSHENQNICSLYVKMTRAVTITFVEKSSGATIGAVSVLPGSSISSSEECQTLLGTYSYLTVLSGTEESKTSVFPKEDALIYVYR